MALVFLVAFTASAASVFRLYESYVDFPLQSVRNTTDERILGVQRSILARKSVLIEEKTRIAKQHLVEVLSGSGGPLPKDQQAQLESLDRQLQQTSETEYAQVRQEEREGAGTLDQLNHLRQLAIRGEAVFLAVSLICTVATGIPLFGMITV
ncbi:hypothetical protein LG943_04860 [Streptomonospora sp. S1-112]|uniref:Uncharacterized protein n=1 Tax=Streptomonospora mangrovi TaxID=2883123 RepID=A0A9X3NKU5_9ACTN|nr:hypothetical protein [Streptomonospora mangrovi]MDA0563664.1 hypothetical protein [Streptomonospora mangrovi]